MNWWTVVKFGVSQVTAVLTAYFRGPKQERVEREPQADPTSIAIAMSSGATASREGKLAPTMKRKEVPTINEPAPPGYQKRDDHE